MVTRVICLKNKTYHVCLLQNLQCLTDSHRMKFRIFSIKKKLFIGSLSPFLILSSIAPYIYTPSPIYFKIMPTLLILKCKVFHEELTPSFPFSPFLYPPFFGLYTPAMTNTCCFPTHHAISFFWAFVHVSLLPQFPIHPILHLINL